MPRLRRADCSGPGIRRRRYGKGFAYFDSDGDRIDDPEVLTRITGLAIPPAWADVWICPYPHGHLQATGTDAAGRKQYRYHDAWRERRDTEKFETMARFARALPRLRERVEADLGDCDRLDRRCVLALAVRLLERGFFRIGSEEYAADNESYGLATLRKDHVRGRGRRRDDLRLPGQERPAAAPRHPGRARRRAGGDAQAAARRQSRAARLQGARALARRALRGDQRSTSRRRPGATSRPRTSAPGTRPMLAAIALGVSGEVARSPTGRKRAINRAIDEVARYLGNTPAVCRASYIDPRVFDAYRAGLTIRPALERVAARLEPGELRDAAAGARARGARPAQRARGVAGRGAGRGVARSRPPRRASIRRSDGPAVTPCTTIESSTAATHVHTTASCSAAPSAPDVTITAA